MNALVIITRLFMAIGLLFITAATAVIIFPVALISKGIRLLLIVVLCSLAFTSCKKDDQSAPAAQVVRYHVECQSCLVYFEDNDWNRLNELERSKQQYINVNGKWDYEFTNTKLDSLHIMFYVGVFSGEKQIKATISTNDNRKLVIDEKLGFGPNSSQIEKSFVLALR